MGHQVTIEGTAMAAAGLSRGERRTVEVTTHIRNLVAMGAAVVVEGSLNKPSAAKVGNVTVDVTAVDNSSPGLDLAQAEVESVHGDGPGADGVPAGNASTKTWRAWVAAKVPGVQPGDVADKNRDQLIAAWERYTQQVTGGS